MSEKVKITQEQADAIEQYKITGDGVFDFLHDLSNWYLTDRKETIAEEAEDAERILKAFVIGYEIEPEYKTRDWIVFESKRGNIICSIEQVNEISVDTDYVGSNGYKQNFNKDRIRHATPEEIKAEKERRVWKKLDREVGEFKNGDIGMGINNAPWITLKGIKASYDKGRLKGFFPAESFISFEEGDSDD